MKTGGHTAIHPELGTLDDFHACSRQRAEAGAGDRARYRVSVHAGSSLGSRAPGVVPQTARTARIQYAENPPKKYQDIYPIDFETAEWRELWKALKGVFDFWIEQGVRIFRVDNPHTKAFPFWEWVIGEIRGASGRIFLAEAFTRPQVMYRLAKLGFHPVLYLLHLAQHESGDHRVFHGTHADRSPRIFPPESVAEHAGHPAGFSRSAAGRRSWCDCCWPRRWARITESTDPRSNCIENTPREPGSEEYLNSEKYEMKHWDLDSAGSLRNFIARVNQIRRENPALQSDRSLRFHRNR